MGRFSNLTFSAVTMAAVVAVSSGDCVVVSSSSVRVSSASETRVNSKLARPDCRANRARVQQLESDVNDVKLFLSPKHHNGRIIICNRILPCRYHGKITAKLEEDKKKEEERTIVIDGIVFDYSN